MGVDARTDVHRSTLDGSWNWRMLWPVEIRVPTKALWLTFQLWNTNLRKASEQAVLSSEQGSFHCDMYVYFCFCRRAECAKLPLHWTDSCGTR
jgi:hypothetical protein